MNQELVNPGTQLPRPEPSSEADLSVVVIYLLKGVLYNDSDPKLWSAVLRLQSRVRDYVRVLGLELHVDEAEGYAFLRSTPEQDEQPPAQPRLVARRQLSFQVSLLLALLRKKMLEFDTKGGDTRLVLSREEIIEMVRVFLPSGTNEAKTIDQVNTSIGKIVDLGFLRPLNTQSSQDNFEVRRILKAFVDAQWLANLDQLLDEYAVRSAKDAEDDN